MRMYTVIGIFNDRETAEDAITHLEKDGFHAKDMSLVMRDTTQGEELASSTGAHIAGGAVTGVATGAVIGGLAGFLVGVGAITIPGVGAFLIGGPLAATLGLTGTTASTVTGAATGAVAGGLLGALMGLGIPEEEAREYEEYVKAGGILLAVPVSEERVDTAEDILDEYGATQVKSIRVADDYIHRHDAEEMDEEYHRMHNEPSYFTGAKGGWVRKRSKVRRRG